MTASETAIPRYLPIDRNQKLLHPLDVERLIRRSGDPGQELVKQFTILMFKA
jgi:hypothetical protein